MKAKVFQLTTTLNYAIIQMIRKRVYISTNIQRILILHIMIMNVVISKLHQINSEMSL